MCGPRTVISILPAVIICYDTWDGSLAMRTTIVLMASRSETAVSTLSLMHTSWSQSFVTSTVGAMS